MKRVAVILLLIGVCRSGNAGTLRIDILKNPGGVVCCSVGRNTRCSTAEWVRKNIGSRLLVTGETSQQWQQYKVTIVPRENGPIQMILLAEEKSAPILYDGFHVRGSTFLNGDFETFQNDGSPGEWKLINGKLLSEGGKIGRHCVAVTHENRAIREIIGRKGSPIEISFWAKDLPSRKP